MQNSFFNDVLMKCLKLYIPLAVLLITATSFLRNTVPSFQLIIFEGSDWCSNCRRLEKDILSKKEFQEFLRDHNVELKKIDFPQRKKLKKEIIAYNDAIATKYDFDGTFPTMLLVDVDSEAYVRLANYVKQSPEEMMTLLLSQMESLK